MSYRFCVCLLAGTRWNLFPSRSETMNRIIPHCRPFVTIFVCNAWYVPSRVMSRRHWIVGSTGMIHCATSRKVAGSIPVGVIGIFHWLHPSGRTMALGLTQPLTEMGTRNISWGGVKVARCIGLQPYHLYVPTVLKSGSINLLESSGPLQACNGTVLPFNSNDCSDP
jgi:hypothetical protein